MTISLLFHPCLSLSPAQQAVRDAVSRRKFVNIHGGTKLDRFDVLAHLTRHIAPPWNTLYGQVPEESAPISLADYVGEAFAGLGINKGLLANATPRQATNYVLRLLNSKRTAAPLLICLENMPQVTGPNILLFLNNFCAKISNIPDLKLVMTTQDAMDPSQFPPRNRPVCLDLTSPAPSQPKRTKRAAATMAPAF
jgi:hypothetical protein